jgi:hypothetical protein
MSHAVYTTSDTGTSTRQHPHLPTIRELLYSPLADVEQFLEILPQFSDSLSALMSTLISHECRLIGC